MATTLAYASSINYTEVLASSVPAISGSANSVQHTAFSTSKSLSSTVVSGQGIVTDGALFNTTMSGGAATIDLTSLTGTNGRSITLLGLKVQAMKFINPSTNANNISVTKGASNGFGLGSGGTTFTFVLPPGSEVTWYANEGTPDVASGAKTIDISGTSAQVLQCAIFAG